uniref:Sedoheptulokinase n=1 Tax=Canis lupus familiaris TaxID=9615 RepID=A0A8I3NZE0_CANLF
MAARVVTLGIDLGSTSVKAALLEAAPGHPPGFVVLASCARAARAEAAAPQGQEQDVSRIIQALNECLAALPRQLLQEVCGIGVSGQMHGVMFWKTDQEKKRKEKKRKEKKRKKERKKEKKERKKERKKEVSKYQAEFWNRFNSNLGSITLVAM